MRKERSLSCSEQSFHCWRIKDVQLKALELVWSYQKGENRPLLSVHLIFYIPKKGTENLCNWPGKPEVERRSSDFRGRKIINESQKKYKCRETIHSSSSVKCSWFWLGRSASAHLNSSYFHCQNWPRFRFWFTVESPWPIPITLSRTLMESENSQQCNRISKLLNGLHFISYHQTNCKACAVKYRWALAEM